MSHYYERSAGGEIIPRHFVPMASRPGESRPTRISDARKFGWAPSVTTIQGLLDKPALNDWRVTEHLKVAYGHLKTWQDALQMSLEEYLSEIKELTQDALDKAPKDGTDFHDSMEHYLKNDSFQYPKGHLLLCHKVKSAIEQKTLIQSGYNSEHSFIHEMGFGGKVDLHFSIPAESWVIDYKTKNTADKFKRGKMAYPEHCMQLAAYRVGLGLHNARCANVFICLENGEIDFHEHGPESLDAEWANFADLLRIWLRKAQYVPGKV